MGGGDQIGVRLLGERYRLIEQLGAGGMSVVWRGYDEVLGRQVAVKVLASRLASDRAFRHRIRIEAQAAARLCHPNITNVYDYGEAEQAGVTVPYVVMELIDGSSLGSRLRREGRLPWREALTVAAEIASALATAHARGLVHRDVTPGNVMLTPTGVKVVDFGISALVGESEKGADGTLLGTPAYLAPERLDNGQVSPATDVYAVGVLLHRMLTGRLPWQASTSTEMLRAHMYADPEPMPPVPGLPDGVADLVRRCLAKRPGERPPTADLARALADAAGMFAAAPVSPAGGPMAPVTLAEAGTTILPRSTETDVLPFSRTRRQRAATRRRRVEAGVAAAGLVAVTAAVWGLTSHSPAGGGVEPPTEARMGLPATPSCQVTYALRSDTGKDFAAELTLTNTGERELRDWAMRFTFPGQQTVTRATPAVASQQGKVVVVRPAAGRTALAPGAAEKVSLTGRYSGANPLPVTFHVGGERCDVQVSGVAGRAPAPTKAPATAPATAARGGGSGGSGAAKPKAGKAAKPDNPGKGKGKGKGGGPGKG
ncbi:serine/threonine-protein kinase [Micromonospora globbae]|uniref:non-specific serine/threonine protein kinase n=1 Tax=Micromonospora globbae TaxID=1894969 RepID=A0A420EZJ7_9ACTN|nr:serine/threonine-protein kinase [Micromonospora globbae]RKF26110.1 serine/threonine protein kinase [Micromonospora globbae]